MQSIQAATSLKPKTELNDRIQAADPLTADTIEMELLFAQVVQQVNEETTDTAQSLSLTESDGSENTDDQAIAEANASSKNIENSTEIAEQVLKTFAFDTAAVSDKEKASQVDADRAEEQSHVVGESLLNELPKIPLMKKETELTQTKIQLAPELVSTNSVQAQAQISADKVLQTGASKQTQVSLSGADTPSLQSLIANTDSIVMPAPDQSLRNESVSKVFTQEVNKAEYKWGEQMVQTLRDQVQLQVNQKVQQATIRLDPPELGSLEIQISHEAGRLSVTINASHADVARLIQQSSDRLRNELAQAQFNSVDVRTQSESNPGQQHSRQRQGDKPDQAITMALSMEQDSTGNTRTTATDILVTV